MTAPALHGRDAPLGVARAALASARGGRGRLVLVEGEAGIGKSALAEVLADEARAAGAEVTWGRAWEFAEAPPYFPLWPCMRAIGVAPERGELDAAEHAFEAWERVLAALAQRAAAGPVVWIVDDIHAADLGTLDLLTYLAQPLRALRALVIATVRPHDPRLDERKLRRVARMARDGIAVRLEPLPAAAIAAVAAELLGQDVPARALDRLAELTGGNPLFVVECARASRAGGLERVLEQLPPSVRHVVAERVALLPGATRRLLDAGAVLGRELAAATLARVVDADAPRVIDELLPALRSGVLREIRPGQFAFSHAVVRDAIEDALPADERARLHARAADALRDLGDRADVVVERARHALAAARALDPGDVLALARRAAAHLEREGAYDRAFALHARVEDARAAGLLPPASPADHLHVARVARDAGRLDVMQRRCEQVVEAARAAGDPELFARAVLLHAAPVRVGVVDARQIALLEEARAALAPGTPATCRVLARLATALQPADDPRVPNGHARAALAAARALGDDAVTLDVLDLGALGLWGAPRAERVAWCEEQRDRALAAGDVARALTAWSLLAQWYVEGGELERFAGGVAQALALADRAPHPRDRWAPLLVASGYACALGNFAESERYVTEVAQIAALVDDPGLAVAQVNHALGRAALRGDAAEVAPALAALDHPMRDFKWSELIVGVTRAAAHARLGDVEATRAELARIGTQARVFATDVETIASLAEAYALAGSDDERRWARDVLARSDLVELFSFGVGFTYDGPVERLLGLLDAGLGELDAAEARLRRAYERVTASRMRPWIERLARELAAVVARRGGDPREVVAPPAIAPPPPPGAAPAGAAGPAGVRATRHADVWTIEHGAAVARVKDSRGMQLLARLLERPGEELHVLALASDDGASAPDEHAGELLDERARRAYRRRLAELDEAIAEAERRGDADAARRRDDEKAALVRELARATGLGGRARVAGSSTERARVNVQRRLREAIARIAEADAGLGALLERAVRTGTFCCFRP